MNQIDPTAVIQGDVSFGDNNVVLPYCVLIGPLSLGDGNQIGPHVTVGTPGQDTRNPRYDSSAARIEIGSRNIIREYTGVQKPCYADLTRIGDDCYLMQSVHVPHDAVIEDQVVITPMVALAGLVHVMQGANIGLSCAVHQHCVIGAYSLVAMGSMVTRNVRPFSRHIPGKPISVNHYALEKFGFTDCREEVERYVLSGQSPTSERIAAIVERFDRAHRKSKRDIYS
jgi:UDP-N-acetylglucosamine acyltransferase